MRIDRINSRRSAKFRGAVRPRRTPIIDTLRPYSNEIASYPRRYCRCKALYGIFDKRGRLDTVVRHPRRLRYKIYYLCATRFNSFYHLSARSGDPPVNESARHVPALFRVYAVAIINATYRRRILANRARRRDLRKFVRQRTCTQRKRRVYRKNKRRSP